MSLTNALVRILAEAVTVGNGVLDVLVNMPSNAASPLDPNAAVTALGSDLIGYLASGALTASNIMCVVVNALL